MNTLFKKKTNVLYKAPEGLPQFDTNWLESYAIPQSMQFMIDLIPTIYNITKKYQWGTKLSVLDIGTSVGSGANILATLNKNDLFGTPMKVDAMDIVDTYKKYANVKFPNINYIVGDIFTYDKNKKWDLVICSHTIEHFTNPIPFMQEVINRAKNYVIFYAPYMEQNLLNGGHLIQINDEIIQQFNPYKVDIVTSPAWKHPVDKESKCVIFVVKK